MFLKTHPGKRSKDQTQYVNTSINIVLINYIYALIIELKRDFINFECSFHGLSSMKNMRVVSSQTMLKAMQVKTIAYIHSIF